MKTYRKKPVIIEAIKWDGNNPQDIIFFCGKFARFDERKDLYLTTLENKKNEFEVAKGDFIIKGVKGEFYACKEDIFNETYDEVAD